MVCRTGADYFHVLPFMKILFHAYCLSSAEHADQVQIFHGIYSSIFFFNSPVAIPFRKNAAKTSLIIIEFTAVHYLKAFRYFACCAANP